MWTPNAVVEELKEGQRRGYDGPLAANYDWLVLLTPASVPSEWLTLDLGMGELETMALALENPDRIVILDVLFNRGAFLQAAADGWLGNEQGLFEGFVSAITPVNAYYLARSNRRDKK